MNSENLDLNDESIDGYIANMVLNLTTDPNKMLKEAYRVL